MYYLDGFDVTNVYNTNIGAAFNKIVPYNDGHSKTPYILKGHYRVEENQSKLLSVRSTKIIRKF